MTETFESPEAARGAWHAQGLSAWWWLGLPLGIALVLVLTVTLTRGFYDRWIESETGLLEIGQILLLVAGLIVALRILALPALRGRLWLRLWVGLAALACFYIAGEEASWGQHFLQWSTPEGWSAINDQQETNLHNVSSWFDQKPRLLLEIGVILGGIVIPLLALWRPAVRRGPLAVILPPLLCLPSAAIAEASRIGERLADVTGQATHIFPRASEVQELFFYLFILLYLITLRRRLDTGRS